VHITPVSAYANDHASPENNAWSIACVNGTLEFINRNCAPCIDFEYWGSHVKNGLIAIHQIHCQVSLDRLRTEYSLMNEISAEREIPDYHVTFFKLSKKEAIRERLL